MDLTLVCKILEAYGYPGIFCVVLVGLIWFVIKQETKQNKKTLEIGFTEVSNNIVKCMSDQNKLYVETLKDSQTRILESQEKILDALINKELLHEQGMEKRMNADTIISNKLHEMMLKFMADRAVIIEFHNNNVNLAGLPFTWYDVHYEQISPKVDEMIHVIQNQPTSVLSEIIDQLRHDRDQVLALDTEDIEKLKTKSTALYKQLKSIHASGLVYSPILSSTNKLIGLVALEYTELPKSELPFKELIDQYAPDVKAYTAYINSLLLNNPS